MAPVWDSTSDEKMLRLDSRCPYCAMAPRVRVTETARDQMLTRGLLPYRNDPMNRLLLFLSLLFGGVAPDLGAQTRWVQVAHSAHIAVHVDANSVQDVTHLVDGAVGPALSFWTRSNMKKPTQMGSHLVSYYIVRLVADCGDRTVRQVGEVTIYKKDGNVAKEKGDTEWTEPVPDSIQDGTVRAVCEAWAESDSQIPDSP